MAFVSLVDDRAQRCAPDDVAKVSQRGCQGVAIVRISVQRLGPQNKMPALGRMQIGGRGNFAAELVRRTRLAFADAFHFRGVPGKKITRIAAPLLRDAPGLTQCDFQPLRLAFRQRCCRGHLAPHVAQQAPQRHAQELQLPLGPLLLLRVQIASRFQTSVSKDDCRTCRAIAFIRS